MANQREQKLQKKREKDKKKREQARKARAQKSGRNTRAAEWPLSESWISQNWHEQGAHIHAMLTRTHTSGRMAAAVFEIDLAERGVVNASVLTDADPAEVQQQLARNSTDLSSMQVVEPELIMKMVREADLFGETNGHKQAADISKGLGLFPDVDARDCPHAILVGKPSESTGTEAKSGGLWSTIKKTVGLGS
jgi:hypothetical protein